MFVVIRDNGKTVGKGLYSEITYSIKNGIKVFHYIPNLPLKQILDVDELDVQTYINYDSIVYAKEIKKTHSIDSEFNLQPIYVV